MRGPGYRARARCAPSPPENRGSAYMRNLPGTREPKGREAKTAKEGFVPREALCAALGFSPQIRGANNVCAGDNRRVEPW